MKNIFVHGELELEKVSTKETTEWDYSDAQLDSEEMAAALITEYTGEPLFDFMEALYTWGSQWPDIREVVKLFYPIYANLTRGEALRQAALEGWMFQPAKTSYAILSKKVTHALLGAFKTTNKESTKWQTP